MKLYSTRNINITAFSKEAIINGLASDGGLYTPKIDDIISKRFDINEIINLDYKEIAKKVFKIFLSDFSDEEIVSAINGAYNHENFGEYEKVITPITKIGDNFLLELYHGPTSAFKDVALTILPHFLSIAKDTLSLKPDKANNKIYILTATSGDTGKAALSGFKDVKGTYITVFYPTDGVSDIQKLQMNTSLGNNVSVVGLLGDFDDCQRLVKEIYTDENIKNIASNNNIILSSANSINIGRLVPQITYYIYSYIKLVNDSAIRSGDLVNFVVPTGNFGDILAGFIAKLLGTPINKLICASNDNNVLTDFINTGIYNKNRKLYKTISPSMDILVSSNLERLLFLLSNNDSDYIKNLMDDLKAKGSYKINDNLLSLIKESFEAYSANESECISAIKMAYEKDNRLIDTHTAVAYSCLKKYENNALTTNKSIILSTASPYKFVRSVIKSIKDVDIKNMDDFECMNMLYDISKVPIPKNLSNLKNMNIRFNQNLSYDDCKKIVINNMEGKI